MDQTREIQKRILEVYKRVEEICEKNNLRYFALAGTCLGAVRHQGFIPWDDDLDLVMPLDDFKKFLSVFQEENPEHLTLFSPSTARHDYQVFVKVMDDRTMITEDGFIFWKDTYEGAWVDIFPMSGSPAPGEERDWFVKRAFRCVHFARSAKQKFSSQPDRNSKRRWVLALPFRLLPKDYLWKRWLRLLERYPFDESPYIGQVWDRRSVALVMPHEVYAEYVTFDFEDTKIRCPVGYEEYLTQSYGDYMEYPPEDQRNSGHFFDHGMIDLEHSYKDYQSGKYKIPAGKQDEI